MADDKYALQRRRMVETQLKRRGIREEKVLDAFRRVPREKFLRPASVAHAYEDMPYAIGHGQTISQPYIVALMTRELALEAASKVLEIGTGSGYQTAILAELAGEVFTVERIPELARRARRTLEAAGYANVHFQLGDGTLGWPSEAPFDRIIVTAAAPLVPAALREQLASSGRIVIPVGSENHQDLLVVEQTSEGCTEKRRCPCVFVKLIGQQGWRAEPNGTDGEGADTQAGRP